MKTCSVLFVVALGLFVPVVVMGQTYSEIQSEHPNAVEMLVTTDKTNIYEESNTFSTLKEEHQSVRIVLAFESVGDWFKAALPGHGFVGYVRKIDVTLLNNSLEERAKLSEMLGETSQTVTSAANSDSPCLDPLYLEIKEKPLGDMTEREYDVFKAKDMACTEYLKIAVANDENSLADVLDRASRRSMKIWLVVGVLTTVITIIGLTAGGGGY